MDEIAAFEIDLGGPFTLDEIDDIERACRIPASRWFDGASLEAELLRAIMWIYARRSDPAASLRDQGSNIRRVD